MPAQRIFQLGDPMLRQKSRLVGSTAEAVPILADLRETLEEFRRTHGWGRGISAVQIGQPLRIIYVEFEGTAYSLINPEFDSRSSEKIHLWDNCFSFPGLLVYVERCPSVTLRYKDGRGGARILPASGALSELLQHEMDHLDGTLAIDRAIDRNGYCTKEEYDRRDRREPAKDR